MIPLLTVKTPFYFIVGERSLWDDHYAHMLWLDSTYPTNSTLPSDARGSCATDSGDPDIIEVENADASVTFSNVKIGEIGSTYSS